MRVLLVFPTIIGSDYGLPRTPPLGISYLGAAAKKAGHQVKLIDMRLSSSRMNYFKKTFRSFKPHLVGVSATSFAYPGAKEVFAVTKQLSSRTLTILGGPHAAIVGNLLIKDKNLDMLAIGEGEELIVELLEYLAKKKNFRGIKGLVFKDKRGRVITNPPRPFNRKLDALPFPQLNLLPLKKYRVRGVLTLPIMTSRGCPFGCIYCVSYKTMGKLFRARSYQNVVDEIEMLVKKYQVYNFTILDDNFTIDPQRTVDICQEIIRRNLKINWQCDQGIRADRADYRVYKAMKASGCQLVAIGVENPDPAVLRKMNKGETIQEIKKSIKAAKKAGLVVKCFFIIGCPGDNLKLVKKSIRFFKEMDIDLPRYSMMTVYPGSALWDWVEKHGRFVTDPYEYIIRNPDTAKEVQFETNDFPAEERLKSIELASDEAEKWMIRYKLKAKFGKKLGLFLYPLFRTHLVHRLIRKMYQMKLIKVVD